MNKDKAYGSTLTAALDFFGTHEGQTKVAFGKEFQTLNQKDRSEIKAGLEQAGYKIEEKIAA